VLVSDLAVSHPFSTLKTDFIGMCGIRYIWKAMSTHIKKWELRPHCNSLSDVVAMNQADMAPFVRSSDRIDHV